MFQYKFDTSANADLTDYAICNFSFRMKKTLFYVELMNSYSKAHPQQSKLNIQNEVNAIWNGIKNSDDLPEQIAALKAKYAQKSMQSKASLTGFWSKAFKKMEEQKLVEPVAPEQHSSTHQTNSSESNEIDSNCQTNSVEMPQETTVSLVDLESKKSNSSVQPQDASSSPADSELQESNSSQQLQHLKSHSTPGQDSLRSKIDLANADLVGLLKRKSCGLLSSEQEKELTDLQAKKNEMMKSLERLEKDRIRHKCFRLERKRKLSALPIENRKALKLHSLPGRPRLEFEQTMLLKTICDLAIHGSAADNRRQSEIMRSIKTLDELKKELENQGFVLSRSALYLRLQPRLSSSMQGKRHVATVPVRLIRAQNDSHEKHVDGKFCTATIRSLEELASLLGPNEVAFLSQDDKARVPIGLTAANKQAPLMMHLEYKVTLPDHDWVVASQHKLVPSVYAGITIKSDGLGNPAAVGYSGPTYVAIRSGKHSSSTAYAHALDFETIINLPEFQSILKTEDGKSLKPIIIISVDGGPDENPRYKKVIATSVHHFIKNDLDAFFIATNAPHRSCFNRVERRMAPLSKELAGIILPHDEYGSHLNSQGYTIDSDLEKRNFEFAGSCLAEVWSSITLDTFPVVSKYIKPDNSELDAAEILSKDEIWMSNHVRTSQYFTQIVKCSDRRCCKPARSSYLSIFESFLPPPIPIIQSKYGIIASPDPCDEGKSSKFCTIFQSKCMNYDRMLHGQFDEYLPVIPYDLYCPSVQSKLKSRICRICGVYFASVVMLTAHTKEVHKKILVPKKIRPIRIAAKRQRELMAIISINDSNDEDCEWIEEEIVDVEQSEVEKVSGTPKLPQPIFEIDHCMSEIWEDYI